MTTLRIRKSAFDDLAALTLRAKGAYAGTVTKRGPLVSDNYLLFNRHFVHKPAAGLGETLVGQKAPQANQPRYEQKTARTRLRAARAQAIYEGELLGQIPTTPALRVKAEHVAGVRYRRKKRGRWRYVWLDAHRLRLLAALFKTPLRFFCADWDAPIVLKRGTRTVGCLAPAAPCPLGIEVKR